MESGKSTESDKIIFPIIYNRRNVDIDLCVCVCVGGGGGGGGGGVGGVGRGGGGNGMFVPTHPPTFNPTFLFST